VERRRRSRVLEVRRPLQRTEVAGGAEVLGDETDVVWRDGLVGRKARLRRPVGDAAASLGGAVVVCPDASLVAAGERGRPTRRTDRRRAEGVREPTALCGELVDVWRLREVVAVTAQSRTCVLERYPEHVRRSPTGALVSI